MNPVIPIVAKRTVRAAAAALIVHAGYRLITGKTPSFSRSAAVNAGISLALCAELISNCYGPCDLGFPGLFTRISSSRKVAALTFDDGPSPESTPYVLDILDKEGVKATFFFVGENAEKHPDLVQQTIDRGHSVAPHGYQHIALSLKSEKFIRSQIYLTNKALGDQAAPYFRPPYGFKSQSVQRACRREGVRLTAWSIDPKDYLNPPANVIVERVVSRLHPGAIVLLHEWASATRNALPCLIEKIRERGYELVTLASCENQARFPQRECSEV